MPSTGIHVNLGQQHLHPKMITGSQQKHDGRSMMFFLKASNISALELEMEFVQSSFLGSGFAFLSGGYCMLTSGYIPMTDPWLPGKFTY